MSGSGDEFRFHSLPPPSGQAEFLKSFGRREAYESLGCLNPRDGGRAYGDLGWASPPVAEGRRANLAGGVLGSPRIGKASALGGANRGSAIARARFILRFGTG